MNNKFGIYTKKLIKHFRNPHNYGKIKNADGIGKVGNIVCGDVMWLYIKVGKNKRGQEIIKDIKFETYGCPAAIGTTSVVTDLAKGKTIEQALKITNKDVIDALDSLPPIKVHCSLLAEEGLTEAIYDYLSKNKKEIRDDLQKKHERIKKAREIIEKKYEIWREK